MFEEIHDGNIYKYLINGEWKASQNHDYIDIYSPVTHKVFGKVQSLSRKDIDEIILNSINAQKIWSAVPVNERAAILHKAADLLNDHIKEISSMLQDEIAKDIESSDSEVQRTVDFIRYTADEGKHLDGEVLSSNNFPGFKKTKISFVTRVPLGVVLAISPFNYPINLTASKIAPALIAGNSVILKPATQGAISSMHLAEIFNNAGIPKGVLNVVTGRSSEIGDYIATHKGINFINFTGSTEVGKHIADIAGMVPMIMELGGKDAAIVLDDADLDDAAADIVSGAYNYSGQRCTAVKRILVSDKVAEELVPKLKSRIEKLKVGNPKDGGIITPLIDSHAAAYVQELIDDAISKGATLITGNKRNDNLLYPTLFDNVTTDMRLAWEEPFGPVLPIIRVKDIDEAINITNKSQYGLQSSIFTRDINNAFYISSKLDVGTVQINNKPERGPDNFPFTGTKNSGMGTQGIRYSIEAMSRPKSIVFSLN